MKVYLVLVRAPGSTPTPELIGSWVAAPCNDGRQQELKDAWLAEMERLEVDLAKDVRVVSIEVSEEIIQRAFEKEAGS